MTDRERDAKVAEKIMGWRLVGDSPNALTWKSNDGTIYTWFATSYPLFRPSERIENALQVVEKMLDNESLNYPDFKLEYYGFWRATFFAAASDVTFGWDEADTAPLAICHAALKAMEDEDDGR